jgi:pimeloyl-ACP methyl ester carboxylesterase
MQSVPKQETNMLKAAIAGLALTTLMGGAATAETAEINGLAMYYEVHGEGEPLVLIHGAYMTIDTNWAAVIPAFTAAGYQVIAMDLQAHGKTSDRDTPIRYETMADDVAALMDHLKLESADVFGYSMGAGVGIRLAMQHPDKVERLVAASGATRYDAFPDGFKAMIEGITPEMFAGSGFDAPHTAIAETPGGFATLVDKLKDLDLQEYAWPDEEVAKIDVPTLLIFGDADVVEIEHATHLYRLFDGITDGDTQGLPDSQLLVLPGTSHIGVFFNPANVEIIKTVVPAFLKAELPAPPMTMGQ